MSAPAVGPDGELFTRGGPNVPDNRGQSMVGRLHELWQERCFLYSCRRVGTLGVLSCVDCFLPLAVPTSVC